MVRALLPSWGLKDLIDPAELVVSELVANAYLHAAGTDSFALELKRRAHGVMLSVADGSATRPVIRESSHYRPSGRGMRVIAALAAAWGAEDDHGGKRVWVEFDSAGPGAGEPAAPRSAAQSASRSDSVNGSCC